MLSISFVHLIDFLVKYKIYSIQAFFRRYKRQRGVFRERLSVGHAIKFNRLNLKYDPIICYCFAVDTLVNDFSLFWNEISLARGVLVSVKRNVYYHLRPTLTCAVGTQFDRKIF